MISFIMQEREVLSEEIAHEIRDIGCQDKPRSHFGVFTACRLE